MLLPLLILILLVVVVVQIGKVTELASKIRGEEDLQLRANNRSGAAFMVFLVLFFVGVIWSTFKYKNYMLGYGPHEAASAHGGGLDSLFNITLLFTGIVFFLTHIALFYFAWKYRQQEGTKAQFISHNNTLELVWTAIPAIVMTFLVFGGLDQWNEVMADVPENAIAGEDYTEIEATGMQFAWLLRYPGADGQLGSRDYKQISGTNPLGQVWSDPKNIDDFHPSEIVLPVNKPVRVRITARDVLHNFALPHFRLKMDAVPGMPTYFVFTPTKTTEQYRQELRKYDEYNVPSDPSNPDSEMRWETFNYELACQELCGKGHYSMKRIVRIVEEDEYEDWLEEQQSYYLSSIRGSDNDPFKGELLDFEIQDRKREFNSAVEKALSSEDEKIIRLKYVTFQTGKADLTPLSRYEISNLADVLRKYPNMTIEVAGHTDNTGNADANLSLSDARAKRVYDELTKKGIDEDRLVARGYGQNNPIDTNDTAEGRQNNRRTEFKILTQ